MTLCSSWVDEVAENAEKRSMEAGPWSEVLDTLARYTHPEVADGSSHRLLSPQEREDEEGRPDDG